MPWTVAIDEWDRLLVGGGFHVWGGKATGPLARWDGMAWETVGDPLTVVGAPTQSAGLRAISTQGGEVVVAGVGLQAAGGLTVKNLARWDGSSWSDLGGGTDGSILAILQQDDRIYVGGAFTAIGGVAATNVASWDGTGWVALGDSLGSSPMHSVEALVMHEAQLYAGGRFTHSGPTPAFGIARWTGIEWVSVGEAIRPPPGPARQGIHVRALLSDAAGLYVAGQFEELSGMPFHNVARWDGSAWQPLATGVRSWGGPAWVSALAPWQGGVMVGGLFHTAGNLPTRGLAWWDGQSWSAWGEPPVLSVVSMASSADRLVVLGWTSDVVAGARNGLAVWDANQWRVFGQGFSEAAQVRALAATPNGVVAGGRFSAASETLYHRSLACFDGEHWRALGEGLRTPVGSLPQVVVAMAPFGDGVVVGGDFRSMSDVADTQNVARWDGQSWSAMGGGLPDPVAALAVSGARVYAGCTSGVAVWEGRQWTSLGLDSPGPVFALAVEGEVVYAVQRPLGIVTTFSVHRWDGSQWSVLAPETSGQAWAAALTAEGFHVAGMITDIGGVPVAGIAKWQDGTWSPVGAGLAITTGPAQVLGLTADPMGRLSAVGLFNVSGESTLRNIARYESGVWSGLGSSLALSPSSLATQGLAWRRNALHVGGAVYEAGGNESLRFAVWHDPNAPLWIELGGTPSVRPSEEFALSLSVVNLRELTLAEGQVTLALPPGVTAVSASEGAVLEPRRCPGLCRMGREAPAD